MESSLNILLIILFIAGACIVAYLAYVQDKKRREELESLAAELGWSFEPAKDRSHDSEYAHFEIFRRGHSRAAHNTLTGSLTIAGRAHPAKMGDFTYKITTSSGKSTTTTTYRFSYLIIHLPFANVPDLLIRREGMFDKLAGAFGFDDIDFESVEFSRRFHVKSPDKRFAYDVCHPRMIEFLMKNQPPCIDIEHSRCCLSNGSSRWSSIEFRHHLDCMQQFLELWPEHLTVAFQTRTS